MAVVCEVRFPLADLSMGYFPQYKNAKSPGGETRASLLTADTDQQPRINNCTLPATY